MPDEHTHQKPTRPPSPQRRASCPSPLSRPPQAGEQLLHPVVIGSILLLLLNDHVLKAAYPGWWTGKLSDLAGLAFFPLLLQAAWELVCAPFGRFQRRSNLILGLAATSTGLVFSAIQLFPFAGQYYRRGLGFLQWLVSAGWLQGRAPWEVQLHADPTDLLTLPALLIPLLIGWQQPPK